MAWNEGSWVAIPKEVLMQIMAQRAQGNQPQGAPQQKDPMREMMEQMMQQQMQQQARTKATLDRAKQLIDLIKEQLMNVAKGSGSEGA